MKGGGGGAMEWRRGGVCIEGWRRWRRGAALRGGEAAAAARL